jgi:hypothetical protein
VVTGQALVAQVQGWVAAIGPARGESAAVIVLASADLGRVSVPAIVRALAGSAVATGLVLVESAAATGQASADQGRVSAPAIVRALAGSAGVIGPASADLGRVWAVATGLASAGLVVPARCSVVAIARAYRAAIGPDFLAIARDSQVEPGPSPAGRDREPGEAANVGQVPAIGLDGLALVQAVEEVANGGRAAAIARDGLAIVLEFQAETGPSPVATGRDGLAIGPELVLATSVPAMSDRLATTSEL